MIPRLHVEQHAPASALVGERASAATARLPVVMLHGWGMNLRVFDRLREQLSDAVHAGADANSHAPPSAETWAIDLPGHGQSPWWPEAADFDTQCAAVLAVLPPRCVLVGWSLGAKLALALAAQHPARVAALALLSATPMFMRATDWPHGMEEAATQHFRTMLAQDWRRILNDFVWLQVRGSRDAESAGQVLESALTQHGQPHREALLAGMHLLETIDLRTMVSDIRQPTLLVAGLNDRVTLPGAARWLAQAMPQAQLLEVPRAGHAPFVSHHLEVAAAMRSFLATLRTSS